MADERDARDTASRSALTRSAGRARGYDVIVIGGGHNGLVAAAYLARAGRSVLVLERRPAAGGALATGELAPGVRGPVYAHTVGRLSATIARELDLREHGLRLLAPAVRAFAPQPDGRAVVLHGDPAVTAAELRSWSPDDATAYLEFDRRVRVLGRFLGDLADETPPDIAAPGFGDALAGLRLGRSFRGLGRLDGRTVLRVLPMAVADFVAEAFACEPIRAALAWRGVRHTAMGPWSAGTTKVLLDDAAGNDGGAAGETVYARGGPGALAEALVAAVRKHGGVVRHGVEVARITTDGERVTGVALTSGEELDAGTVVAGIDPKQLLTDLVDPVVLGPSLRWRAGNLRTPGTVAKVNLVLDGLPEFPAAADDPRRLRGRILVGFTSIDAVERAFDASKYGRISDEPVLEATIPSLVDPSLVNGAPEGTQVVSVLAQWAPRDLADGDWSGQHESLGDRVVARLESVAPGIGARVRSRQVLTPADLESELGVSGGHPLHVEPGLESFFLWRPLLGWARYRMPVAGLYLAGSGAHPGGGVTGLPGRNAAREVIADTRRSRLPGRDR